MKWIPFVAGAVALKNMMGFQLKEPNDKGELVEATVTHRRFLFERLSDSKYYQGLKAAEQVLLSNKILTHVDAELARCEAAGRGWIRLEDEWHKRFVAVTEEPSEKCQMCGRSVAYPTNAIHCYVPFIESMLGAKDKDPAAGPEAEEHPAN